MSMIRVMCGALIRLQDPNGRYGLLGSRSKYRDLGRRVLTPVGGAIEASDDGMDQIVRRFSVDPKSFENGNDLRLRMDEDYVDAFRIWFNTGGGIELSPARREMCEELGPDEHGLLTAAEVESCGAEYYAQFERLRPSARRGQEGVLTHSFLRFYQAIVSDVVMTKLVELSEAEDNLFEFVTADEIRAEKSARGSEIPDVNQLLLQ